MSETQRRTQAAEPPRANGDEEAPPGAARDSRLAAAADGDQTVPADGERAAPADAGWAAPAGDKWAVPADGERAVAADAGWAALADAGWRAPSRETIFGWEARFAAGVTKRANSAWSGAASRAVPSPEAIAEVEATYRARGLVPCFQLSPGDGAARRMLAGRGYRLADDTLVLAASVPPAQAASPEVEIARAPSAEWLACWWAVDRRGGDDELEVARQIVTGTPSLYAAVRVGGQVVSVARLALVAPWGGIYCVATRAAHRRHGYAMAAIQSLLAVAANECGVTDAWLQVLADNAGAIELYSGRLGFREVERYCYLTAPNPAGPSAPRSDRTPPRRPGS